MQTNRDRRSTLNQDPNYLALAQSVEQVLNTTFAQAAGSVRLYPLSGGNVVGIGVLAENEDAAVVLEHHYQTFARLFQQQQPKTHIEPTFFDWEYPPRPLSERTTLLIKSTIHTWPKP